MSRWTVQLTTGPIEVSADYLEYPASGALCFFSFDDPNLAIAVVTFAVGPGRWDSVKRHDREASP